MDVARVACGRRVVGLETLGRNRGAVREAQMTCDHRDAAAVPAALGARGDHAPIKIDDRRADYNVPCPLRALRVGEYARLLIRLCADVEADGGHRSELDAAYSDPVG